MHYKKITARTILNTLKSRDEFFGIKYTMNLYRGCQHGCIYCDSRSKCYGIDNFSEIQVKTNAIELLSKELRSKRTKDTIGFGSMNDPYMPIENKLQLTRRALEIIHQYRFPVHLLTKSDNVVRDCDIISEIGKLYSAVSITITSVNDDISKITEPGAPSPEERFRAVEILSKKGIYTGIIFSPLLPFITDTRENVSEMVKRASGAGAGYILSWMGMTMREGQREYYYDKLDKNFPGVKKKYIAAYGNNYQCAAPEGKRLYELYKNMCSDTGIATRMNFYRPKDHIQLNLFD